jgi:hypothetical protein
MTSYHEGTSAKDNDVTDQASWFFVVGQGRSGSTLLGNLLTDTLAGFHCGELQSLWEGIANERLCTCGVKLGDCTLWSSVVDRVCTEMGFQSAEEGIAASRQRTRQNSSWRKY